MPRMFASKVERGLRLATPTIVCAPRWKTALRFVLIDRADQQVAILQLPVNGELRAGTGNERLLAGVGGVPHQADDVGAAAIELSDNPAAEKSGCSGHEDVAVLPEGIGCGVHRGTDASRSR